MIISYSFFVQLSEARNRCDILGARSAGPMRSGVTCTVGRASFWEFCPAFEFSVAYSAAEGSTECILFDAIDGERGYKRDCTYPVCLHVVDLAYVLFSLMCQGEEVVTRIISALQSLSFDVEVFKSYLKSVADCDELCQQVEQVDIIKRRFYRRFSREGIGMEANCSGTFRLIRSRCFIRRFTRIGVQTASFSMLVSVMKIHHETVTKLGLISFKEYTIPYSRQL